MSDHNDLRELDNNAQCLSSSPGIIDVAGEGSGR